MVHSCNHSCHPQDKAQDCVKGCPWPFSDDTIFDARGYPHHRRRPCGGHCPNCRTGRAMYGKHATCLNRLIVEYSPTVLELWEGHANVKYAATVQLFEYLYKYLFKGPSKTNYDVTLDGKVVDEISEWLKGRYLCATEAAWRMFGYNTYDRWPHVVCLPVHLPGQQWIVFDAGEEANALDAHVSPLQRYFYRPTGPTFDTLTYNEYYETYMTSPKCPSQAAAVKDRAPLRNSTSCIQGFVANPLCAAWK